MEYVNESVIVSVSLRGRDEDVLIVGRQNKRGDVDIINAFNGKEARDLYEKLTKRKTVVEL